LSRVRVNNIAVEKQKVFHIPSAYSLSYPACNAKAKYCRLWPALLYSILTHYLIKGMIFEKEVTEYKMCVLMFYTSL